MVADRHEVLVVFPRGRGGANSFIAAVGIEIAALEITKPVLPSKSLAYERIVANLLLAI